MLRLLLKSVCFLMLAACALCAQESAPAEQPAPQRPPRRIILPPGMADRVGEQQKTVPQKNVPQAATASKTTATSTTTSKTRVTKKGKHGKPVVEETPIAVAPPPPPLTPEQLPAGAPQVSYHGGLLSINSQNSTLGDILNAVRKLTGGTVDAPGTTLSERIATRLGPAPPKDVLLSLFSGSRFDYIILGSERNPNGIERIILTPREKGSIAQATGPARPAGNGAAPGLPPAPLAEADADAEEDTAPEREQVIEEPSPQAMPPEQQQQPEPQVQQQQAAPGVEPQNPQTEQQNPPQPKTPEQLLKELQDMQRQRQSPTADQPEENPR